MRVYEPNKDVDLLNDVLKELYLIRMAVDHQSLNVSNIIKMIDQARDKVRSVVEIKEQKDGRG
tara:strand:+ start:1887 stop:2075 length:189 start_codon:yes stop_codon:yes gene_type:complete